MAEATPKYFDYTKPEHIECIVPGDHRLREVPNDVATENSTQIDGDKGFTYTQVMTVTKEETALTKGDVKLQKVSVKEDVSDENAEDGELPGAHQMQENNGTSESKSNSVAAEANKKDKRPKRGSRLPTLKFRQVVDKIKTEKKEERSENKSVKEVCKDTFSSAKRRSSIPRLKKDKKLIDKKTESSSPLENKDYEHINPEDAFEKIFDEIVDNGAVQSIKDISSPIDDVLKLENKFEKIVHDYEENTVQPINVDKIRQSRIPLLKRQSELEIKLPNTVRRPSLHTNSNFDDNNIRPDYIKTSSVGKTNVPEDRIGVEGVVIRELTLKAPMRPFHTHVETKEQEFLHPPKNAPPLCPNLTHPSNMQPVPDNNMTPTLHPIHYESNTLGAGNINPTNVLHLHPVNKVDDFTLKDGEHFENEEIPQIETEPTILNPHDVTDNIEGPDIVNLVAHVTETEDCNSNILSSDEGMTEKSVSLENSIMDKEFMETTISKANVSGLNTEQNNDNEKPKQSHEKSVALDINLVRDFVVPVAVESFPKERETADSIVHIPRPRSELLEKTASEPPTTNQGLVEKVIPDASSLEDKSENEPVIIENMVPENNVLVSEEPQAIRNPELIDPVNVAKNLEIDNRVHDDIIVPENGFHVTNEQDVAIVSAPTKPDSPSKVPIPRYPVDVSPIHQLRPNSPPPLHHLSVDPSHPANINPADALSLRPVHKGDDVIKDEYTSNNEETPQKEVEPAREDINVVIENFELPVTKDSNVNVPSPDFEITEKSVSHEQSITDEKRGETKISEANVLGVNTEHNDDKSESEIENPKQSDKISVELDVNLVPDFVAPDVVESFPKETETADFIVHIPRPGSELLEKTASEPPTTNQGLVETTIPDASALEDQSENDPVIIENMILENNVLVSEEPQAIRNPELINTVNIANNLVPSLPADVLPLRPVHKGDAPVIKDKYELNNEEIPQKEIEPASVDINVVIENNEEQDVAKAVKHVINTENPNDNVPSSDEIIKKSISLQPPTNHEFLENAISEESILGMKIKQNEDYSETEIDTPKQAEKQSAKLNVNVFPGNIFPDVVEPVPKEPETKVSNINIPRPDNELIDEIVSTEQSKVDQELVKQKNPKDFVLISDEKRIKDCHASVINESIRSETEPEVYINVSSENIQIPDIVELKRKVSQTEVTEIKRDTETLLELNNYEKYSKDTISMSKDTPEKEVNKEPLKPLKERFKQMADKYDSNESDISKPQIINTKSELISLPSVPHKEKPPIPNKKLVEIAAKIEEIQSKETNKFNLEPDSNTDVDHDIVKNDEDGEMEHIVTSDYKQQNISTNKSNDTNTIETDVQNEVFAIGDSEIMDIDPEHVLKGKVSRIINTLHKVEVKTPDNEIVEELPRKKMILSKIAVFERPEPNTKSKPHSHQHPHHLLTRPQVNLGIPIIVKEVLKSPPPCQKSGSYDDITTLVAPEPVPLADRYTLEQVRLPAVLQNDGVVYEKIDVRDHMTKEENPANETEPRLSDSPSKEANTPKVFSPLRRPKSFTDKTREDIDESNLKRVKSLAELDIGDAVKGKVQEMIVRINSMEKLDIVEKKEVINIKERPRKKTVLEKIALFESKVTVKTGLKRDFKLRKPGPPPQTSTMSEDEYQARINELKNTKSYGRLNEMTYVELKNGVKMPILVVGTALLDPRLAFYIISAAIDLGYRAIDTAYIYGNEKIVGDAIKAKIEDGSVKREDLFIVNKLWSTFHRPDLVEAACRKSLETMGLDYFDLYLIHTPMSFKEGGDPIPKIASVLQYSDYDFMDAWYSMEDLVRKGLVRSIGVSNFNVTQLGRVLEKAKIPCVVNQVECHPYLTQPRLAEFCKSRDIRLNCFGVLGSKGTPQEHKSDLPPVIDDPLVKVLSAGLNVSPAQLLVRFQIDRGHTVTVKGSSGAHLRDTLQALNFTLSAAELRALNGLNRNKRTFTFKGMGDTHKNYPFNELDF